MSKNGKLLFKYIAPSVVSVIAIFLCTVIDGIFVGRGVSTDALGAINIAYPLFVVLSYLLFCLVGFLDDYVIILKIKIICKVLNG